MFRALVFSLLSTWFVFYVSRILWRVFTKGQIYRLTAPFERRREKPMTLETDPKLYKANLAVWLMIFPLAVAGWWLFISDLFAEFMLLRS